PKILMVAPMSGHFATLLRGTVEAMLPEHVEQLRALGYLPPEPEGDTPGGSEGTADGEPSDAATDD
ncbi:MAG TPA: hypothetical protein ENO23_00760, partial [Alphaproteobacteria bacterium]|nr:hypothetical protein [Alphaproteobacteria bacterium]